MLSKKAAKERKHKERERNEEEEQKNSKREQRNLKMNGTNDTNHYYPAHINLKYII